MAIKIRKKVEEEKSQEVVVESASLPEAGSENIDYGVRTSTSLISWINEHGKWILASLALLVVALVIVSIISHFRESDKIEVSEDLFRASYTYVAPTKAEAEEFEKMQRDQLAGDTRPSYGILTYSNPAPSEKARNGAIFDHLEQFLKNHSGSALAPLALLMKAGAAQNLHKSKDASADYGKVVVENENAKNAAFQIFAVQGKVTALLDLEQSENALKLLENEVRSTSRPMQYKAYVMQQMATIYEQNQQMDKAVETYVMLAASYVGTIQAGYAKARLDVLIDDAAERIAKIQNQQPSGESK